MLDNNKKYDYVLDICLPIKDDMYKVDLESISNYNFYPTNPCFYIRKTSDQYKISLIYSLKDFDNNYTKFILGLQSCLCHIFLQDTNSLVTYKNIEFKIVLVDVLFNFFSTLKASADANFLKGIELNIATIYGDMVFHIEDISNKTMDDIKILT